MTLEQLRALIAEREKEEAENNRVEEEEARNRGHEAAVRIRREERKSSKHLNPSGADSGSDIDQPKKKKAAPTVNARKKNDVSKNKKNKEVAGRDGRATGSEIGYV